MRRLIVHTDGGSRGNPGPAAIGVQIELGEGPQGDAKKTIHEISHYLGETTNNVAEYQAVIAALNWLTTIPSSGFADRLEFYLDSQLVVEQLKGNYAVKQAHLFELVQQIKKTLGTLPYAYSFTYVPRAQNARADALVNQALDAAKRG